MRFINVLAAQIIFEEPKKKIRFSASPHSGYHFYQSIMPVVDKSLQIQIAFYFHFHLFFLRKYAVFGCKDTDLIEN
jgi:hypothetical protein